MILKQKKNDFQQNLKETGRGCYIQQTGHPTQVVIKRNVQDGSCVDLETKQYGLEQKDRNQCL